MIRGALQGSLGAASGLCRVLPRELCCSVGAFCGRRMGSWLSPDIHRTVRSRLAALRAAPMESVEAEARAVFGNFGRYMAEFLSMHRAPAPEVVVEGRERLEAIRASGKGAVLLTAHLGNWEMGAAFVRRFGLRMLVVALPHADGGTDRLFNAQRRRAGLRVAQLGRGTARLGLEWLRQGGCLGMLGDLNFGSRAVRMDFCGSRSDIPVGPAWFSLRARVPLVPVFFVRENGRRFRLIVEEPINSEALQGRSGIEHMTRRGAAVLENYIRRFPAQWLAFQPVEASRGETVRERENARSDE